MTKTEPAADGFLHPQSENHAYMIPPASGLRSESVLVALLILVVLLCYGNTLANGFVLELQYGPLSVKLAQQITIGH